MQTLTNNIQKWFCVYSSHCFQSHCLLGNNTYYLKMACAISPYYLFWVLGSCWVLVPSLMSLTGQLSLSLTGQLSVTETGAKMLLKNSHYGQGMFLIWNGCYGELKDGSRMEILKYYRFIVSWLWKTEVMKLYLIRFKAILHTVVFQLSQNVPCMGGISI